MAANERDCDTPSASDTARYGQHGADLAVADAVLQKRSEKVKRQE
jgi:hypothetical protein